MKAKPILITICSCPHCQTYNKFFSNKIERAAVVAFAERHLPDLFTGNKDDQSVGVILKAISKKYENEIKQIILSYEDYLQHPD